MNKLVPHIYLWVWCKCYWNLHSIFYHIKCLVLSAACAKSYVLVRINQTVELKCPRQSTTAAMDWFVPGNVPPISKDSVLYWNTDNNRISITGNHSIGQYNLRISDIKTSDLGMYRCTVSIKNVAYQHEFKLYIGS